MVLAWSALESTKAVGDGRSPSLEGSVPLGYLTTSGGSLSVKNKSAPHSGSQRVTRQFVSTDLHLPSLLIQFVDDPRFRCVTASGWFGTFPVDRCESGVRNGTGCAL